MGVSLKEPLSTVVCVYIALLSPSGIFLEPGLFKTRSAEPSLQAGLLSLLDSLALSLSEAYKSGNYPPVFPLHN